MEQGKPRKQNQLLKLSAITIYFVSFFFPLTVSQFSQYLNG